MILSIVPLSQCIKLPGISDQKLFRRNVRQSLGINNKVNKAMRNSIVSPEKRPYFFFFHNGITALCSKATLSEDKKKLTLQNIAVVNGCQSLSTIFSTSGKVASNAENKGGSVLFRFYEIPQFDLGEAISINTKTKSKLLIHPNMGKWLCHGCASGRTLQAMRKSCLMNFTKPYSIQNWNQNQFWPLISG